MTPVGPGDISGRHQEKKTDQQTILEILDFAFLQNSPHPKSLRHTKQATCERRAPWARFRLCLLQGVVTLGCGMKESRALFIGQTRSERKPRHETHPSTSFHACVCFLDFRMCYTSSACTKDNPTECGCLLRRNVSDRRNPERHPGPVPDAQQRN